MQLTLPHEPLLVKMAIPALAALALEIGDQQVRNRGTLGGSVANNDPAADYPSAVLGLGATVITTRREIAADDYFQGMFTTALGEGEIIKAIRFPVPRRAAYSKFHHPASGYAMAGAFVADTAAACASPSPAPAPRGCSAGPRPKPRWRSRLPPPRSTAWLSTRASASPTCTPAPTIARIWLA